MLKVVKKLQPKNQLKEHNMLQIRGELTKINVVKHEDIENKKENKKEEK